MFFFNVEINRWVFGFMKWISYVIDAVSKFKMDGIKLSLLRMDRMVFQSGMTSLSSVASNSKQIDSKATFTIAGGFAIDRTSDNCFFFMPLTAKWWHKVQGEKRYFIITHTQKNGTKMIKIVNMIKCCH